jgi:hypothetical protein
MDRAGFVDPRDPGRDLRAEQEGLAILKSGWRPITREKLGECSLESEQPDEGPPAFPMLRRAWRVPAIAKKNMASQAGAIN